VAWRRFEVPHRSSGEYLSIKAAETAMSRSLVVPGLVCFPSLSARQGEFSTYREFTAIQGISGAMSLASFSLWKHPKLWFFQTIHN
jgi:hypothetical protein